MERDVEGLFQPRDDTKRKSIPAEVEEFLAKSGFSTSELSRNSDLESLERSQLEVRFKKAQALGNFWKNMYAKDLWKRRYKRQQSKDRSNKRDRSIKRRI